MGKFGSGYLFQPKMRARRTARTGTKAPKTTVGTSLPGLHTPPLRSVNERWLLRNASEPADTPALYAPASGPFCEAGRGILPNSPVSFACQAGKHHLCASVYKQPSGSDFVCACSCGHAH
jgi:hypothetical protein